MWNHEVKYQCSQSEYARTLSAGEASHNQNREKVSTLQQKVEHGTAPKKQEKRAPFSGSKK